jgi:hypothetical protein
VSGDHGDVEPASEDRAIAPVDDRAADDDDKNVDGDDQDDPEDGPPQLRTGAGRGDEGVVRGIGA